MKKNKLRVALAGFGVVGKRRYECLINHRDFEVVAAADKKFSSGSHNLEGVFLCDDYRALFNLDLDVLFVSLPNDAAPDATKLGIQNDLHVFCEKPPGRSVEDIHSVAQCYQKKKNLKVKYGFNHRYHGSVKKAENLIDSKIYGKIINLRAIYGKSKIVTFGKNEWRANKKYSGGGILIDQGIHLLDLITKFGGKFEKFKSFISNSYWKEQFAR